MPTLARSRLASLGTGRIRLFRVGSPTRRNPPLGSTLGDPVPIREGWEMQIPFFPSGVPPAFRCRGVPPSTRRPVPCRGIASVSVYPRDIGEADGKIKSFRPAFQGLMETEPNIINEAIPQEAGEAGGLGPRALGILLLRVATRGHARRGMAPRGWPRRAPRARTPAARSSLRSPWCPTPRRCAQWRDRESTCAGCR